MAGGIAPFSLQTYGQARRNRTAIAAAVGTRLMPPWHAERKFRRYLWDPSLSKAQISAITRWAAAGGPKGDAASPGAPLPPVSGGLTRADVRLQLPTYTPKRGKRDDYHCFVVAWPDQSRYVTGFDVAPGERREVHHMIVFGALPRDAATVDAWDAAEPGPGYSCYGGPSATRLDRHRGSLPRRLGAGVLWRRSSRMGQGSSSRRARASSSRSTTTCSRRRRGRITRSSSSRSTIRWRSRRPARRSSTRAGSSRRGRSAFRPASG